MEKIIINVNIIKNQILLGNPKLILSKFHLKPVGRVSR